MGFTKNWVSHAIWCSWQLVSFGCSVLQHRVFSGTQNWFWSATWLSSCQHHTFGGGGVARILCGLLMVTLLFQQLLFFLMWFPYPWAMLSMVTFASVLPKNVIWPQTLVGNSQSPLSHRTPTTSSHLGHLQFSARSVTTLFWKALFYRDDRNGNYIQMGINSWCFNKTPIPAFLGTFFFIIGVGLEVPSFSCLWPDFSLKLFLVRKASSHVTSFAFSSVPAASQTHRLAEVLHQALPKQSPDCTLCARSISCHFLAFLEVLIKAICKTGVCTGDNNNKKNY